MKLLFGLILMIHLVSSVPTDTAANDEERDKMSIKMVEKVDNYFEQKDSEISSSIRVVRQSYTSCLNSGDTVALQTYAQGKKWLSCAKHWCHNSACPNHCQNNNFWNNCTSSVFQIYRKGGSGCIRTGDKVGFHYPALSGHWLACVGPAAGAGSCYKSECPDFPSATAGFSLADLWESDFCDREVFEIAACGRRTGYCIRDQDRVFLRHVHRGHSLWLALGGPGDMNAGRLPCPTPFRYNIQAMCGPPYDSCVWESFKIWKKP